MRARFASAAAVLAALLLILLPLGCALSVPTDAPAENPAAAPPKPAPPAQGVVTITVFNTGDIHEHTAGLARIAARVKAARKKDPNVLFFDAGDAIGGYGEEPLAVTKGEAMFRLMIAAGYDACVFGNHCHGLGKIRFGELGRKYPKFPLLIANVQWRQDEKELAKRFPPYKIFRLKGVTVAVIGACSHDVRYARRHRFAVYYEPQAVHRLVPILRKKADIVIAITHQYEKHDYITASGPNAPDLIVGGHSHGAAATPYGREKKSYLLKAGKYTRYLGTVTLKWDGKKIIERTGNVVRVGKDWPEDAGVKAIRDEYFKAHAAAKK